MTSNDPFNFDVSAWPELPSLRGVFVTGTDTEVGKTLIAGAIARSLRAGGRTVEVFKPAASGCRRTPAGLVSEDAEFLAACAESRRTLAEITPLRYAAAVAPNVAAERLDETMDIESMFQAYSRLAAAADAVVVEGVGGLMCPISDELWVIHFARMTRLPLIIVARAELGTINHTLLTIHAARAAGLNVAGVIINRYRPEVLGDETSDTVLAMHTNPTQIARHSGVPVLALVPDEPANSVADAVIGPDTQFAVNQVDWPKVLRLAR